MVCAPMLLFASQMSVKAMQTEDSIRDLIIYEKEKLLHENVDHMGMLPQTVIPHEFVDIPDEERRGMVRALRWVLNDESIFQCQ
jgi:hypothetical protein